MTLSPRVLQRPALRGAGAPGCLPGGEPAVPEDPGHGELIQPVSTADGTVLLTPLPAGLHVRDIFRGQLSGQQVRLRAAVLVSLAALAALLLPRLAGAGLLGGALVTFLSGHGWSILSPRDRLSRAAKLGA